MSKRLILLLTIFCVPTARASEGWPPCHRYLDRDIGILEMLVGNFELPRALPRTFIRLDEIIIATARSRGSAAQPAISTEEASNDSSVDQFVHYVRSRARPAPGTTSTKDLGFPGVLGTGKSELFESLKRGWEQRLRDEPNLRRVTVVFKDLKAVSPELPAKFETMDLAVQCLPREWQQEILNDLSDRPAAGLRIDWDDLKRRSRQTRFTLGSRELGRPILSGARCDLSPKDARTSALLSMLRDHYDPAGEGLGEARLREIFARHLVLRVEPPPPERP